jgi:hypothetical protein
LRGFGAWLWNCPSTTDTGFALIGTDRKVTASDAEVLIDLYMTLTGNQVVFTQASTAALRERIELLSASAIDPNAPSISLCDSQGAFLGCPGTGGNGNGGNGGTTLGNGGAGGGAGEAAAGGV